MNKFASLALKTKGATEHFLKSNSPAILAAVAVSGTITTAYLTAKASFRAAKELAMEEAKRDRRNEAPMEPKEKLDMVWRLYIPATISGAVTVSAIVVGTTIGTRRTAAVAAAYTIADQALHEYQERVAEEIGPGKERKIRDQIMTEHVLENPPPQSILITGPGNVLCFEKFTGRYFHSDAETLRKAENVVNAKLNREMYAYLDDFYEHVGLPDTSAGKVLGWDSDKLLELEITTTLSEDGRPCLCVEYNYTKYI